MAIGRKQAGAQGRIGNSRGCQRVIEGVRGDPGEVGGPSHQQPQPGMVQLLAAPQGGKLAGSVTQGRRLGCDRRGNVEQGVS